MSEKKKNSFLLLAIFSAFFLQAQTLTQTENPFSRYGVGELENKGFANFAGMGRATTAFENDTLAPIFINSSNPAALASVQLTSFEAGGKSYFNFLETDNTKSFKNNTYLSYLSLGFPLGRKTGLAFGLSPYSSVGYNIIENKTDENIGAYKTEYKGSGGLNQVYMGMGWKPFKNSYTRFRKSHLYDTLSKQGRWDLIRKKRNFKTTISSISLGANGYFLFGDLDNTTNVVYPSQATYFSTKRIRNTRIGDFYGSFGAMFTIRLDSTFKKRKCEIPDTSVAGKHIEYRNNCPCKDTLSKENYEARFPKKYQKGRKKDTKITFGATVYLPTELSAEYSALAYTYKQFSFTQIVPYDTTLNIQKSGSITMPLVMNFGMGIKRGNNMMLLADVSVQNWSYYRFLGENERLQNSYRFAIGYQFVKNPDPSVHKEIYKNKTYLRAGAYYNTGNLSLKNTLISEYGLTAGVGLPLGGKVASHINISAEFGRWGTTKNNLVMNNFIRCSVGLTLNDKWFLKRVID